MPRWRKNEPNAAERCVHLFLTDDDGQPLEPTVQLVAGTDYYADRGDGACQVPLGTLANTTRPYTPPVSVVTFTNATDLVNLTSHPFLTGDGPIFFSSSGTLPPEITAGVGVYAIYDNVNSFKVATTLANALAGTFINLTGDGSGSIIVSGSGATRRINKGSYRYVAAQSEINYDGSYFALHFWKTGVRPMIMNIDLAKLEIDEIIEDSLTLADCIRLLNGISMGDATNFLTGTQIYKSLNGAKNRITINTDPTGRLSHVIGDPT